MIRLPPTRWLLPLALFSAATTMLPTSVGAAGLSGSGRSASEARSVGEFQAIALRGAIDLEVRRGTAVSVQVQADDNLLPYLETVVEAGADGPVLQVRWRSGKSVSTRAAARVSVATPRLSAIASSGSGDVKLESFSTPSLKLALSGSGDASLAGLRSDELGIFDLRQRRRERPRAARPPEHHDLGQRRRRAW